MVGEVAPVGCVEDEHVGSVTRCQPADIVETQHVGGVGSTCIQSLRRGELEAGASQVHHEGQRLAEGASGVEVGGENDDSTFLDERTDGGEGQIQEETAGWEQDGGDIAARQRPRTFLARGLQMVHATGAELYGEWYRPALRELVRVQAEREAVARAGLQISSRLRNLEGTSLQEDIGGLDRKSTRLNSSHANISYAVFCLK